ncbi:MAG: hypothetical protein HRT90_05105 [Candidatus Margulisbacteria bacterium]|nr:hypothetical protein [Candidatus Margulisiibacteriota bacterium]
MNPFLNIFPEELKKTVHPLQKLPYMTLVLLALPVLISIGFITNMAPQQNPFQILLVYGAAHWLVLGITIALLKKKNLLNTVLLFPKPTLIHFEWSLVGFLIGSLVIIPLSFGCVQFLGLDVSGFQYNINTSMEMIILLTCLVATGPVVHEILFRGLGLGILISKGFSPQLSAFLMMLFFAGIHVPLVGLGGSVILFSWSILVTGMRLEMNSHTAGFYMYLLTNICYFVIYPVFLM